MSRGSREKLGFISRARGTAVRGEGCGRIEGERLRNIGWLVCAGTSLTELPVSLRFSSVASSSSSSSPPYRPLPSSRPPRSALYESLFHSGTPLSLYSPIHGSTFLLLSLLSQPPSPSPDPLSHSPRYVETEGTAHAIHTCSHVHAASRFLLVTANTLRQRGRSLLIQGGAGERGGAWTAEEIPILPSCRGRDIFSLSRDNLETGVALPGRESSEGERLGPG